MTRRRSRVSGLVFWCSHMLTCTSALDDSDIQILKTYVRASFFAYSKTHSTKE